MSDTAVYYDIERQGAVVVWRFRNPPQNLMTPATNEELTQLVEAFEQDESLRVAILTSAVPDVFIQHFDVSTLSDWATLLQSEGDAPIRQEARPEPAAPRGLDRLRRKPVIAAINGLTGGGGCETALKCEFRWMARGALLGLPEIMVGILPGGGGTQRMSRLIGASRALEMMLLGKMVDADEAETIGLVHRACDPDDLLPSALQFAQELATRSPLAVANIMRCVIEGSQLTLREGLQLESELFIELMRSETARELMAAYVSQGQQARRLLDEEG